MARNSGPGGGRFQLRQNLRYLALLLFAQRENWQSRQAAVEVAQIHGVFDAGDAGFRDDGFGCRGEERLQGLRIGMLAALPKIEKFDTLLWQWRSQRKNRALGATNECRIENAGGAGQHLKLFWRLANDFDNPLA